MHGADRARIPPPAVPRRRGSRPRRISRGILLYIGRDVLRSFLLVFAAFEVVILCIFGIGAVKDFGVDVGFIVPLLLPVIAANLNAAIPVSLLFATALVYGRLIADREVAALKSFGFSYVELSLPPAALGAVFLVIGLYLNWYVIPEMRFTKDNLGWLILERLRYLGEGRNRSFELGQNHTLWIGQYDGSRLKEILIASDRLSNLGVGGVESDGEKGQVRSRSYPLFLYAEEGEVVNDPATTGKALSIELRHIRIFYDTDYMDPKASTDFKHWVDIGRLSIPVLVQESQKNVKERSLPSLLDRIAELRGKMETADRLALPPKARAEAFDDYSSIMTEFHRRITFAIVALTFPLAGACIALFLNSPNRLTPVFVSLMLVPTIFYTLEMRGNSLGSDGYAPWLLEESGNVGLLILSLGLFLILRRRTVW